MAFSVKDEEGIICTLCPKGCRISDGNFGDCGIRKNENNNLSLPFYGLPSALNIDPVEKKPLYHFYPGARIFSIGFFGCSFHCPFCQNYSISQKPFADSSYPFLSPEDLIKLVKRNGLSLLAFTYSEPLVHFEYLLETSILAKENDIKTVLVTNGYINKKPAKELLPFVDALNIDLKSFSNTFYRDELSGSLKPVLDFISLANEFCHIEVTTLVIPDKNDSMEEISDISKFISSLSPDIPLHISAYYPVYKYRFPPTSVRTIELSVKTALKYLNYVYPGNTGSLNSNTHCPECSSLLVERRGYYVKPVGISSGICSSCGRETGIII